MANVNAAAATMTSLYFVRLYNDAGWELGSTAVADDDGPVVVDGCVSATTEDEAVDMVAAQFPTFAYTGVSVRQAAQS